MASTREWIKTDETAKEMLGRVLAERPFLPLPPPLHKLPLRPGNVVEIVGPTSSAKTHILMQAAISCILPKEWNGVQFGGMEHLAVFVDLDCRFDVLRFSHLLKHKLSQSSSNDNKSKTGYDEELFAACMRRFLYIRCYDSSEFLATLKTMNYQLQRQKEMHGVGVHLLILDSIGAFYWMDRALPSLCRGNSNRKSLSLQSVTENVVLDIQKLLLVHPLLVLASKISNSGDMTSRNEVMRNMNCGSRPQSHREYMPSVWQSFVTHKIHVAVSDDQRDHQGRRIYLTEWLLPSVKSSETFIVNDVISLMGFFGNFFAEFLLQMTNYDPSTSAGWHLSVIIKLITDWLIITWRLKLLVQKLSSYNGNHENVRRDHQESKADGATTFPVTTEMMRLYHRIH